MLFPQIIKRKLSVYQWPVQCPQVYQAFPALCRLLLHPIASKNSWTKVNSLIDIDWSSIEPQNILSFLVSTHCLSYEQNNAKDRQGYRPITVAVRTKLPFVKFIPLFQMHTPFFSQSCFKKKKVEISFFLIFKKLKTFVKVQSGTCLSEDFNHFCI